MLKVNIVVMSGNHKNLEQYIIVDYSKPALHLSINHFTAVTPAKIPLECLNLPRA